jgi:hypothetical protein
VERLDPRCTAPESIRAAKISTARKLRISLRSILMSHELPRDAWLVLYPVAPLRKHLGHKSKPNTVKTLFMPKALALPKGASRQPP